MLLTEPELTHYRTQGYVVIDAPWEGDLSQRCLEAYERCTGGTCATAPATAEELERLRTTSRNFSAFRLQPVAPSDWFGLEHSLPFLRIQLHPYVVELARQLLGVRDIFHRNGGINEAAPGRAIRWHRDNSSAAQFEA